MIHFERTAILGVGLIGGSLGLALKQKGLTGEVVGIGRREDSLKSALDVGAIDRATLDPVDGVRDASLVILATGVITAIQLGRAVMPHLPAGCLLTDVASAKSHLLDGLEPMIPPQVSYVSSHPMAGSERKGPGAARADLFDGALCILTPTSATRPGDLDRTRQLWQAIGCRTCELDRQSHDRILAEVSHLPHIAAVALVNLVAAEYLPYSAAGFQDTTRVASGDPEIWRDICTANRKEVVRVLRRYAREVDDLADALAQQEDGRFLRDLFSAKQKRDAFYATRGRGRERAPGTE